MTTDYQPQYRQIEQVLRERVASMPPGAFIIAGLLLAIRNATRKQT